MLEFTDTAIPVGFEGVGGPNRFHQLSVLQITPNCVVGQEPIKVVDPEPTLVKPVDETSTKNKGQELILAIALPILFVVMCAALIGYAWYKKR